MGVGGVGGVGMMSGFETISMIPTSCQIQSVQQCSTVPQSQNVLPCCSRSANQIRWEGGGGGGYIAS